MTPQGQGQSLFDIDADTDTDTDADVVKAKADRSRKGAAQGQQPRQAPQDPSSTPKQRQRGNGGSVPSPSLPHAQMTIRSIRLRNIFCYRKEDVTLHPGVSVFAGPNGSGKSSLLEAVFFALYGSKAGPVMGRSLSEVLREGEKVGAVEVAFQFGDRHYRAQMAVRRSRERVVSERRDCVLVRDDGREWVGVEEVTAQIESLLRMDRDDFANCLYIRQGEVDRLIKVGDEERRRMIDRLLRLAVLDDYDRRAKEGAQRAVKRRQNQAEGVLKKLKEDLAALEKEDLHAQQAQLKQTLQRQEAALAELEGALKRATLDVQKARQRLERFEQTKREFLQAKEDYKAKEERLDRRMEEEAELRRQVRELEGQLREVEKTVQEAQRSEAWADVVPALAEGDLRPALAQALEGARREQEALDRDLQARREDLARIQTEERGARRTLSEYEERLNRLAQQLAEEGAAFERDQKALGALEEELSAHKARLTALLGELGVGMEGTLEALDLEGLCARNRQERREREARRQALLEERARLEAALEALERERERAQQLVEGGRCPTCRRPVTAETLAGHTEHLQREAQKRRDELQALNGALQEAQARLDQAQAQAEVLDRATVAAAEWKGQRQRWEERQAILSQRRAQLDRRRREQAELQEQRDRLQARLEHLLAEEARTVEEGTRLRARRDRWAEHVQWLEAVHRALEERAALEERLLERRETLKGVQRSCDELRDDRQALQARLQELADELGAANAEELQAALASYEARQRELERQHSAQRAERDGTLNRLGVLTEKLHRLEGLRSEVAQASRRVERLARLGREVDHIRELYGQVKQKLRLRNLQALNHHFNHFFALMDSGAAYQGITLTPEYDIQVVLKDGRTLSPVILSGGERALINLALRAAIHQVLSQAGNFSMPLILDEPTVYLDRDRVARLERLLEDLGHRVGQVIVVSHEASLVEGADHEYRVEKDADNLGHVEQVR